MSDSKIRYLTQVKQLLHIGKYDLALQILKSLEKEKDLLDTERLTYQILKSTLLNKKKQYPDALKLGKQVLSDSEKLGLLLQQVDARISIAEALWGLRELDESLQVIEKGEELFFEYLSAKNLQIKSDPSEARLAESAFENLMEIAESEKIGEKHDRYLAKKKRNTKLIHASLLELQMFTAIILRKTILYMEKGILNIALEFSKEYLALQEILGSKKDIAYTLGIVGKIYQQQRRLLNALINFEGALAAYEEIEDKEGVAWSLNHIGALYAKQGDLNRALKYYKESLTLQEEIDNKKGRAQSFVGSGEIYILQGELDWALKYQEDALELFKQIHDKQGIASCLYNIGRIFVEKSLFDQGLMHFENSLSLQEEIKSFFDMAYTLFELIVVGIDPFYLEKLNTGQQVDANERSQKYLERLRQINTMAESSIIHRVHRIAEALVLKRHIRARNRGRAEELLDQVVKESYEIEKFPGLDYWLIKSMLHLCDLVLVELYMSGDSSAISEAQNLINHLIDISQKQPSYWLVAETKLLQSRLAMLKLNLEEAEQLLTHAQQIAEKRGLYRLSMKISSENTSFLNQLQKLKEFIDQNVSLADQANLVHLERLVIGMVRQQTIGFPEIEDPVLFLIIAKGGINLFSRNFGSEIPVDLTSGLFSAIQSFSKEIFARSLDRASLGEYTILMKPETSLLMVYVFKGQSYSAEQKLAQFTQNLYNNRSLWHSLVQAPNRGGILTNNSKNSLVKLVKEVFEF
ncbi:MAG: tetratricopeptide repeat protein [Promethearchaeota archaeon]